jgi:hypothetical protein
MKKSDIEKLLASWKTVAEFVYTDAATEETLSAMLTVERASATPRPSVLTLLYQRYSTKRRERELTELWGENTNASEKAV